MMIPDLTRPTEPRKSLIVASSSIAEVSINVQKGHAQVAGPSVVPLDPSSVPDRIISLSSEDDGIKSDARKRLDELRNKHKNDPKNSQYLDEVTEVLYGRVSTINDL